MNEVTLEKNDGFIAIRQVLERLMASLIGLDTAVLSPVRAREEKYAAE